MRLDEVRRALDAIGARHALIGAHAMAAVLLSLGDRHALIQAVEEHIPEVRPDVRSQWRDLLASTAQS